MLSKVIWILVLCGLGFVCITGVTDNPSKQPGHIKMEYNYSNDKLKLIERVYQEGVKARKLNLKTTTPNTHCDPEIRQAWLDGYNSVD